MDTQEPKEEKESPIITMLRNYMMGHKGDGAAEQQEYQTAMNVDTSSDTPKGYAYGGEVPMADGGMVSDLGDVDIPSSPSMPVAQAPARPMPPTSPIGNMISSAQTTGNQLYGQFTPEKRAELYNALLDRQRSMPNALAMGLSSLGDALVRGYGRGQSDFMKNTTDTQQNAMKQGLESFDAGQKSTLAATSAGMDLGKMDPSSVVSKIYQDSYSGPLKKLGYSDAQISKMSASNIEPVAQVGLKYGDIDAQKQLKEATLALTAKMNDAQIGAMKSNAQARQDELKRQQEEANKNLDVEASKHYLLHPHLASQAAARLAAGSGGAGAPGAQVPTFATEADAEKANPPDGTRVSIGGKTGTWRHK